MNYNNFRRGRSPPQPPPPFGYDNSMRPMPNHRDFEPDPYQFMNHPFDGPPGRHYPVGQPGPPPPPPHPHQLAAPHLAQHPFIDAPAHPNHYLPNHREYNHQRPPLVSSSHRVAINHRDPYSNQAPPAHHQPQQPRSSSPPYKILCITNINHKISDRPVKEALTSDFSRFGDISVSLCHDSGERLAYIYFRNCSEAREARLAKTRTIFFDRPIEIEPIYEPVRVVGSPVDNVSPSSPMMPPGAPPVYPPRKRSISPLGYPCDMNGPMAHRRQLHHGDMPSPIHPQHRGATSPDYVTNSGSYSRGSTPPPPMAPAPLPPYDRRTHYPGYNQYPPPHITSPYSSPPHEQYRSSYPPHHQASNQLPYPSAGPNTHPRDRPYADRAHGPSRSPHNEPYHLSEPRGPPFSPHHHHHSSSRSNHYSSHSSHGRQPPPGSNRGQPPEPRHHSNHPPDPPARFMSRDFRREKFGSDLHPGEHDDGRPSRVLLINNIDAKKTESDLREIFEPFGTIGEIEIKTVATEISSALIKFSSMDGAYKAKTANNGRHIGNSRCRIVYGKVSASRRLWIGGLSPTTTVPSMEDECSKYGDIISMDYTSGRPYCYVEYETANQAQFAAHHLRTTLTPALERKIRIEFVDPDRSEKLALRHDPIPQASEIGTKSRTTNDSVNDLDTSPRSTGGGGVQKRSVSPSTNDLPKRVCQKNDIVPPGANTFKQERLAAAAKAKARTSSTSVASHPSDKYDKLRDINDSNELNNNSDSNQTGNGNVTASGRTPNVDNDSPLQEAPSLERLAQCSSIKEVVQCCSVSWSGQVALRSFIFPTQIYMCSGRKQVIDKYLSRPNENGDAVSPLLRITQRWRLHPQPKLEEVKRRMQSGNLGILILTARQDLLSTSNRHGTNSTTNNISEQVALVGSENDSQEQRQQQSKLGPQQNGDPNKSSAGEMPQTPGLLDKTDSTAAEGGSFDESANMATSSIDASMNTTVPTSDTAAHNQTATPTTSGSASQSRPLRNLISYLEQKDAAGVISLSAVDYADQTSTSATTSESSSKLLYAFPPGDFALNLLKRKAPNLTPGATKDEFLLGVIVGGNVEGGKI